VELYMLLQRMVNEIPQSHFAIIPPDRIPRIKSKRKLPGQLEGSDEEGAEDAGVEEEGESDNEIATQMLNGVGLDVRVLSGQMVITRVEENGVAAKAGLRPGFVIKGVDGLPLENVPAGPDVSPILHTMMRETILVEYLGGEPGTEVRLAYLDAENKEQVVSLKRERLKGLCRQRWGTSRLCTRSLSRNACRTSWDTYGSRPSRRNWRRNSAGPSSPCATRAASS
jgi:hypothetical protein